MFKILANGKVIAYCDKLRHIKKNHASGAYIAASEAESEGVAINGKVYNLPGKESIAGAETVTISECDICGDILSMQNAASESKLINSIVFCTLTESGSIDDVTAAEHTKLFGEWNYPVTYRVDSVRKYKEKLYRCRQAHTSQADWTPDKSPALWREIGNPEEEWPEWIQPIGAGDEYASGAKVTHKNKKWISDINNNVWEPGVYGWTKKNEA